MAGIEVMVAGKRQFSTVTLKIGTARAAIQKATGEWE